LNSAVAELSAGHKIDRGNIRDEPMKIEKTQEEVAREELEARKKEREKERQRRKNSYGILNRKLDLSKEVQRRAREMCNCGAYDKIGGVAMHKEDCPVVRSARAKNK